MAKEPPIPMVDTGTKIGAAIVAAKKDVTFIFRDAHNAYSDFNYASVDQVYETMRTILANHGLWISQDEAGYDTVQMTKGTGFVMAYDITIHHAPSGEVSGPYRRYMSGANFSFGEWGKAQSLVSKMFLRGQFMLATGDPDGDSGKPEFAGERVEIISNSAEVADDIIERVSSAKSAAEVDTIAREAGAEFAKLSPADRGRVQTATVERRLALTNAGEQADGG